MLISSSITDCLFKGSHWTPGISYLCFLVWQQAGAKLSCLPVGSGKSKFQMLQLCSKDFIHRAISPGQERHILEPSDPLFKAQVCRAARKNDQQTSRCGSLQRRGLQSLSGSQPGSGSSVLLPDTKMLLSSDSVLVLQVSEEKLDHMSPRPVSN